MDMSRERHAVAGNPQGATGCEGGSNAEHDQRRIRMRTIE